VTAAASPQDGMAAMDSWIRSDDPDVRWIMKTNLTKSRMSRLDQKWLASSLEVLR
jgi:hypothetical protein